jgi:hypothetical protein
MSNTRELLKQAAARREEASSRRGLARLVSAGKPQRQLAHEAHELELEAARLEKEAGIPRPVRLRKSRGVRGVGSAEQ